MTQMHRERQAITEMLAVKQAQVRHSSVQTGEILELIPIWHSDSILAQFQNLLPWQYSDLDFSDSFHDDDDPASKNRDQLN